LNIFPGETDEKENFFGGKRTEKAFHVLKLPYVLSLILYRKEGVNMANQYDTSLSEQQMNFVEYYLDLGHITNAAIKAGYSKQSASSQGSQLLKNPKIMDYLAHRREERKDAIHLQLASYAEEAIKELYSLMKSADSETVKMQAIRDVLDRSGFKPVEKQETKQDTKIEFSFRDPNEDE
jgi:predicted DNA-binding protein YlxM (UPF0122 family)